MVKDNKKIDEIKEGDLRPITKEEEGKLLNIFNQASLITQTGLNGLNKQICNNVGIKNLYKDSGNQNIKPVPLTTGLISRVAQQGISMYPALCTRQILTDNTNIPKFAITLSTATVHTTLSAPLEVLAAKKTLESVGISLSKKQLLSASTRSFAPLFIRNLPFWFIVGDKISNDLQDNILFGTKAVVAGSTTIPFHNIATMAMSHSNKTLTESWKAICQEVIRNPERLIRGLKARTWSVIGASVILSQGTHDILQQGYSRMYDSIVVEEPPSTTPQATSATNHKKQNYEQSK